MPTPPRGHHSQRRETAPNAEWMNTQELAAQTFQHGQILLGKEGENLIGSGDDRHLLTVAGSRAGKSSTCLKPNLLLWPSSVLCIDPKGELARDTAVARKRMGNDVYILDPFGEVTGDAAQFRARFNPLDELKAARKEDVIDDAATVADALIVPDKGGDQHWSLSGKNLIRGLILKALDDEAHGEGAATLNTVRKMLTLPMEPTPESRRSLLGEFNEMAGTDAFAGVLAGVGGTMAGKPPNERGSIISTAVEQTAFLDSDPMQKHLGTESTLPPLPSLRSLKRKPTTIYLVLPASRMATHFRWFRLILTLALTALEREKNALPPLGNWGGETHEGRVLTILEEFPQLGYMRQIEAAAGLMAGYSVKLWTVIQDLPQIKSQYPDSWETFIGNAGVVQAFGNTDSTTLEYVSRNLGSRLITERVENRGTPSNPARSSDTTKSVPLLAPFEVALYGSRDTGAQFIMMAGKKPAYIDRINHREVKSLGTK